MPDGKKGSWKTKTKQTRWIEVTFPEREEPRGSRFDREISPISDMLNLRCP